MGGAFTCRCVQAPSPHIEIAKDRGAKHAEFCIFTSKCAEPNFQIRTSHIYFKVKAKLPMIAAFPTVFNRNYF